MAEGDIDRFVHETYFRGRRSGVLVEVGAAGPGYLSIGQSFHDRGWRVIAIEPNPDFCEAHRRLGRPILQYACADRDSDDMPFTVVDSNGAPYMDGNVSFESFSSLGIRGDFADLYTKTDSKKSQRTILVKVRRLDTILADHAPDVQTVDLLAIDTEGWEIEVMKGLSVRRYRPSVVILENLFTDPAYTAYMTGIGYQLAHTIPPNEVYIGV